MKKMGKIWLEAWVQLHTNPRPVPSMEMWCNILEHDLISNPRLMASRMVARVFYLQDEARVLIKPGMYLKTKL